MNQRTLDPAYWLLSSLNNKGAFKYYVSAFGGNAEAGGGGVSDKMLTLGSGGVKKYGLTAKIKRKCYKLSSKNRILPETWTNSITERPDASKNLPYVDKKREREY